MIQVTNTVLSKYMPLKNYVQNVNTLYDENNKGERLKKMKEPRMSNYSYLSKIIIFIIPMITIFI